MPADKCGEENDGHVCDKDTGHRGHHLDSRSWSATKGGALYKWMPLDQYITQGWNERDRIDR